jgi:hypothetical protein
MNKEIKLTKKTIEEYLRQDDDDNEEERMKRGLLSERGKDNKKYVVESMFISSKGMLRSARKGREKVNDGKEFDNNNVHKKNKSVDFILSNNRKEYDNTKTIELVKLYNNINKFGFKNGSSNVNKYLNRYHKDKIKPLK